MPLVSPSLLTESAAGLSASGKPVLVLRRKEPWAQAPGFFERFAFTQQGWRSLRQAEGVVSLIEVGQADGVTYLVQEFFECEPLRLALQAALMTQQKFSALESVAVVLQAARGLLALDQATPSLAHGDVSASTLLFGSDGQVKLEAVGVASMHPADTQLGPARSELLTLSPEALEGRGGAPSDIFHLGLLWLELLTAKTAFGGTTHAEVKARFEKFPGVTPGHFPGLPQPIPMVLAMMLSKVPSARPTISDLELMLAQVFTSLGGGDSPARVLVPVFERLFPARAPVAPQLQGEGSTPLTLTPAGALEGQVQLGRITTKRMSLTDVTAERLQEEADSLRAAAREWSTLHQRDEGNPRDFALGGALLEARKLTMKQLDQALLHAQSLGATMFDSLVALDVLDEDAVLPSAAGLMKQAFLTGSQLLELQLGTAQAPLLSRDVADDWQVIPLKLEAGTLHVAMGDPSRGDVLDDVKLRAKVRAITAVRVTERTLQEGYARIYEGKTNPPEWAQPRAPVQDAFELAEPPFTVPPPFEHEAWGPPVPEPAAEVLSPYAYKGSSDSSPMVKGSSPSGELHAFSPSAYEFGAGPMLPFSPLPQPMPPLLAAPPSAPVPLPAPKRPPSIAPPVAAVPAPPVNSELAGSLDVALRMLEALFSVNGERGLEASSMISLVRSVAKQAGATGAPLDQVRLSVASVVIAALLEGKRAWEVPSRPAAAACLGPYWHDFEDFIRPLIDGDETLPSDPRGVVLCLCFEVANHVGAVPSHLTEARATIDSLRSRYPPAALVALEIVLAGQ